MFDHVRDVARLLPSDVARVLGVNRCTVSLWFNGHASPHALLTNKVTKLLDLVRAATDAGDLPVPHDVPRRERPLYIRTTILKHGRPPAAPAAPAS